MGPEARRAVVVARGLDPVSTLLHAILLLPLIMSHYRSCSSRAGTCSTRRDVKSVSGGADALLARPLPAPEGPHIAQRADIHLAFLQLGCALISRRFLGSPRPTRENGRPGPPGTASALLLLYQGHDDQEIRDTPHALKGDGFSVRPRGSLPRVPERPARPIEYFSPRSHPGPG